MPCGGVRVAGVIPLAQNFVDSGPTFAQLLGVFFLIGLHTFNRQVGGWLFYTNQRPPRARPNGTNLGGRWQHNVMPRECLAQFRPVVATTGAYPCARQRIEPCEAVLGKPPRLCTPDGGPRIVLPWIAAVAIGPIGQSVGEGR